MEESLQDPHRRSRENCSSLISNSLADIEGSLQRDAEAAYVHTEVQAAGCMAQGRCCTSQPRGGLLDVAPGRPPAQGYSFPARLTPFPCLHPSLLLSAQRSCRRDVGGTGAGCSLGLPLPAGLLVFEVSGAAARKE